MSSFAKKKPIAHRTFIGDLKKRFPELEKSPSSLTLNQISLNYNQPSMIKESTNSVDLKSILEEEGISDKIWLFKAITTQQKRFWPDSVKSFNIECIRTQTQQHVLINESIKNGDNWGRKSISREIDEGANSNFEKKNESESKKSSIFYSEKKEEEEHDSEEEKVDLEEKHSFDKKNLSKSSFFSKSVKSQKKENDTNHDSVHSDTEKVKFFIKLQKN